MTDESKTEIIENLNTDELSAENAEIKAEAPAPKKKAATRGRKPKKTEEQALPVEKQAITLELPTVSESPEEEITIEAEVTLVTASAGHSEEAAENETEEADESASALGGKPSVIEATEPPAPIAEAGEAAKAEPAAEVVDAVDEQPTSEVDAADEQAAAEGEQTEPRPLNVEHFSDYRSIKQQAEDLLAAEDDSSGNEAAKPTDESQELVCEDEEYEDIAIFAEASEPIPQREKKPRRPEPADEEKYDPKKPRGVDGRFDLVELFVFTLAIIMLLTTFVFRHSIVEGESMENTLHGGEHLIISDLFYEPEQYDVIVCEDYSTGYRKPIVKRVIATEGQTVTLVAHDEVYVDGELVDYSFVSLHGNEIGFDDYPIELTVPKGEVFVMGDHRNNSLDSRQLGTIKEDAILGKVLFRFYPFDKFGTVK